MAAWNDVTAYLRANFKIAEEEGDVLTLLFTVHGDRSQLVLVSKATIKITEEEFAQIESPIAAVGEVNVGALLKEAGNYVVGGIVQYGESLFVRHTVPLKNVDENELMGPLELVMRAADQLEATHTGADRY